MKLSGLILLLCLSGFFLGLGCSGEEAPPLVPKPKVVKKAIAKAPAEPAKPVAPAMEEKARPEEKLKPEPPAAAEEKSKPEPAAMAPEKQPPPATPKTEEKPASQPQPMAEKKESRVEPPPKTALVQAQEKPPAAEPGKSYYAVRKGDTLAKVSGRSEVYGDPLKWAVLYRTNLDVLGSLPPSDTLPDLELPSGIRLRILTDEEMKRNVQKRAGSLWVVNALSAVTQAEVVSAVISLVKHKYPVYITTAKVNEKDWMRLRVGFFKTRAEADEEGKKIMELLRFKDSWTTKLGANEFAEFARY